MVDLSPISPMKGGVNMLQKLQHFEDPFPGYMGPLFPVKDLQDNGDGTYQGYYDLDNMSCVQKLCALSQDAYDAIIDKLHIMPTMA